jgi:hypothetical protein
MCRLLFCKTVEPKCCSNLATTELQSRSDILGGVLFCGNARTTKTVLFALFMKSTFYPRHLGKHGKLDENLAIYKTHVVVQSCASFFW